jgi:hypothetical protein
MHGLQIIDTILGLVTRRHPLLLVGLPGIFLLLAGIVTGLYTMEVTDQNHVVPLGTALVSTLLIIAGLLLEVTSVILHSLEHFVGRIRQELNDFVPQR